MPGTTRAVRPSFLPDLVEASRHGAGDAHSFPETDHLAHRLPRVASTAPSCSGAHPDAMRPLLLATLLGAACSAPSTPPPPAPWEPSTVYRLERTPNARGFTELRGLIHAHSPYSHDACDGTPRSDAGVLDAACMADFRRGLCQVQHDFVFLTDHNDSFSWSDYPGVLLHDPAQGDSLVTRAAGPSANWLACPGAQPALILAGTESAAMPVGLEAHAGPAAQLNALYGSLADATLDGFRAAGAINLVAHTEDWTAEQLATLHLDGFEMFNLHRSALKNGGVAADYVLNYVEKGRFEGLPHPDLFLLLFDLDDPVYVERWGTVLARGHRRVTTMGSDCHRNTFPQLMQDGERVDSYRRMMRAFSNHLLVRTRPDGTWDDAELKEALRAGRVFGVFEFMGYAQGFDFHAREAGEAKELGAEVSLASGVTLEATMPRVQGLDPAADPPRLELILWRAVEGGWEQAASTTEATLSFTPTLPGAYRVEVRLAPRHLKGFVGTRLTAVRDARPWVLTSALYVTP